jgi:2,5-diketo-D-gluconate reductase A
MSTRATPFPSEAVELADAARMPLLGFGTWNLRRRSATEAVGWALDAGYRLIDTATMYGNERAIGSALADSDVPRDEVFVTTKCPPRAAGRELETLQASLDQLGTDHVDLWLIHWPVGGGNVEMWRAFIEARDKGLATSIGVSNFSLAEIDELTGSTDVTPAVNQVEWSPLRFDRGFLDGHRERGVVVEGYSGLKGGTIKHRVVTAIAERLRRTPAQVVIRWHLQHGVVVIPKSARRERIVANADVADFEISDEDMAALDGLGRD